MHCFDSTSRSLSQVSDCLKVCKQGIADCRDFAFSLQKDAESELAKCQKTIPERKQKDPVVGWIACYESLIVKFDENERLIKDEFSNYI
jgi:hypothetical protein